MSRCGLFLIMVLAVSASTLDQDRMADALRLREGYRGRDGRHHERGPYQLTHAVWVMHMPGQPFALARHERPARACALRHLTWLRARLEANQVEPNAFNLAAAWNAGINGYIRGQAPVRTYLFAGDVERLYHHP